jgi:hypothetical protein
MYGSLPPFRTILQEQERRVQAAMNTRRENEAVRRMRIRRNLRKAIVETHRLDGDFHRLAAEFCGLVVCTTRRVR